MNVYVRGLLCGVGPGAVLGLAGVGVRQDWALWRVVLCVCLAAVMFVSVIRAEREDYLKQRSSDGP